MGAAATGKIAQGVAIAADVVSLIAETTNVAAGAVGVALSVDGTNLPDCEVTHTGTVQVTSGGVNVTGTSIFNSDVGVDANVNVSGDVNAAQVHATQGISAVGGGIWLGDVGGTTFSSGITIGGGGGVGRGRRRPSGLYRRRQRDRHRQ